MTSPTPPEAASPVDTPEAVEAMAAKLTTPRIRWQLTNADLADVAAMLRRLQSRLHSAEKPHD